MGISFIKANVIYMKSKGTFNFTTSTFLFFACKDVQLTN